MFTKFDKARLGIVLRGNEHSSSDVSLLTEDIDMLASAAAFAAMSDPESGDKWILRGREILSKAADRSISARRFFPEFAPNLRNGVLSILGQLLNSSAGDSLEQDVIDPMDIGVLVGVNSWIRREILVNDRQAYAKIFGFAQIERIQHSSPLVVEVAVALSAAAVPGVVLYGLMRAVAGLRRQAAEAEIRELEVLEKKEILKQRRIQTAILHELHDALHETRQRDPDFHVPESVLAAAAQISSPAVSDLGSSSLIGNVTFGMSAGGK